MGVLADAAPVDQPPRDGEGEIFVFRLYVAGAAPHSAWAILNVTRLCEAHLHGRYELEVIDVYQQPERARDADLVAAPTLIKELPLPLQRFIGTMADTDLILTQLGLPLVAAAPGSPRS